MRVGYCCISLLTGRTTNHNCQLKSATPGKLRSLIAQNLEELDAILHFNAEQDWRMFRIGSSVIPFASHPVNKLRWWDEFGAELATIGAFARKEGMRLSMHPGQYTVLSSPEPTIVRAAIAELEYAARFLDSLGQSAENKVVIHLGGVYGDKAVAMDRFVSTTATLPDFVRARLVIENDERSYNLADALAVSARTGLPVVFDNLHHMANSSPQPLPELVREVFATWRAGDGPPKVHFSSQAQGERPGKHAVMVDPAEWAEWIRIWQASGRDFDVMLEAKGKDEALRAVTSDQWSVIS